MKILLTGDKGFLGSEFVKKYGSNYEIVGFDSKDGFNLLDYDSLKQRMEGAEMVVHLAAIPAPRDGFSFDDYFKNNVEATLNVCNAALENSVKRVVYASSTTIYGIERGIPFSIPIKEDQKFVSQYINAEQLNTREIDLSYHMSKVMAEQVLAWFGLNKKLQTTALRFGPINKVFLGTSVSIDNATQAIKLALDYQGELWYEAFSIVDETQHIDINKAKNLLGYRPEKPEYTPEQIHSTIKDKAS
jgi:nucleoside-diphosphate-sugar epimerase